MHGSGISDLVFRRMGKFLRVTSAHNFKLERDYFQVEIELHRCQLYYLAATLAL